MKKIVCDSFLHLDLFLPFALIQLGDTAVEKHRLERTARQDTKVKAALSKRIHMLEKSIAVRFDCACFGS
jgi:hypothetical protein